MLRLQDIPDCVPVFVIEHMRFLNCIIVQSVITEGSEVDKIPELVQWLVGVLSRS